MSYESESVDKLTALYESQSPSAFIAFAMEGLPETTHDERYDATNGFNGVWTYWPF